MVAGKGVTEGFKGMWPILELHIQHAEIVEYRGDGDFFGGGFEDDYGAGVFARQHQPFR